MLARLVTHGTTVLTTERRAQSGTLQQAGRSALGLGGLPLPVDREQVRQAAAGPSRRRLEKQAEKRERPQYLWRAHTRIIGTLVNTDLGPALYCREDWYYCVYMIIRSYIRYGTVVPVYISYDHTSSTSPRGINVRPQSHMHEHKRVWLTSYNIMYGLLVAAIG